MTGSAAAGALADVVGEQWVATDPVARDAAGRDCWPRAAFALRDGEAWSVPEAVVRPADTAQVADCVRAAAAAGLAVIAVGGGSGVCGGTVPTGPGAIALDVGRLAGVREMDETSLLVRVGAGTLGEDLERDLAARGYTCGHFPSSMACSTVGGWIATRSAGQFSTRYGTIADLCVAVTAVLADGQVLRTPVVPRQATGPSLLGLVLGCEGTLAIVTEAWLRVFPIPAARWWRGYAVDDFATGTDVIRRLMRAGLRPAAVRLYDELDTARHRQGAPDGSCLFVIGIDGADARLVDAEATVAAELLGGAGALDLGAEPGEHWLAHRYDVSFGFPRAAQWPGAIVDTMETAAPWSRLAAVDAAVRAAAAERGVLASRHLSHAYPDGACLYYTLGGRSDDEAGPGGAYDALWAAILDAALGAGATTSHHHGIGLLKAAALTRELGPAGRGLLDRIAAAADPAGTLNPGKLGLPDRRREASQSRGAA